MLDLGINGLLLGWSTAIIKLGRGFVLTEQCGKQLQLVGICFHINHLTPSIPHPQCFYTNPVKSPVLIAAHPPDAAGRNLRRNASGHRPVITNANLLSFPEAASLIGMNLYLLIVLQIADQQNVTAYFTDNCTHLHRNHLHGLCCTCILLQVPMAVQSPGYIVLPQSMFPFSRRFPPSPCCSFLSSTFADSGSTKPTRRM